MIIKTKAFPRVGLIGNPSDGYHGKTISFVFKNFNAQVILYETPGLEILPNEKDHSRFNSINGLVHDVNLYGYYGGIRILKAAVKVFYDYCMNNKIQLHKHNFTIRYNSDIPHQVGLAGSSAIITACFRALMTFYQVDIPLPVQANLILSVEKDELDINAGLQDRVVQVYENMVYMDFDKEIMQRQGYGLYEEMDVGLLPRLYIAYKSDLSEGSEKAHKKLRDKYEKKDKYFLNAIDSWINITDEFKEAIIKRNIDKIPKLLNANFDIRREVYNISTENQKMVNTARSVNGVSAKFTGSGGAIVGTYKDEKTYKRLEQELKKINITVLKPIF